MCEYCRSTGENEINGKTVYTYEWNETAGYEKRHNTTYRDILEMFILKCEKDEKAGLMIDSGFGARYIDINYCPMCGRKI